MEVNHNVEQCSTENRRTKHEENGIWENQRDTEERDCGFRWVTTSMVRNCPSSFRWQVTSSKFVSINRLKKLLSRLRDIQNKTMQGKFLKTFKQAIEFTPNSVTTIFVVNQIIWTCNLLLYRDSTTQSPRHCNKEVLQVDPNSCFIDLSDSLYLLILLNFPFYSWNKLNCLFDIYCKKVYFNDSGHYYKIDGE